MSDYNRTEISPFTRATAEQINSETAKIQAVLDGLRGAIDGLITGTPLASYTWVAFADSADGTSNFTIGEAGARRYVGLAYNRLSAIESIIPSDYTWTLFRGQDGAPGDDGGPGEDGIDGADGNFRDIRFKSSNTQPSTPIDPVPAGWTSGVEGTGPHWFTIATKNGAGALLTAWSTPVRLTAAINRGPYSAGSTYYISELVTFNGGTYSLKVTTSIGNAPTGTDQPNAYWEVVAAPGETGAPATPPGAFTSTIDLTASASGINLRTIANAAGYTGFSNATVTFRVPAGVTIQGLANGIGIDTGTWPTGTYTITLALIVQNGGKVYGGGGDGGMGGTGNAGFAGSTGGDAIYHRVDMTVTIDAGGEVKAGGGGGGGGLGVTGGFPEPISSGGGGGGGGFPNGGGALGGDSDIGTASSGIGGTVSGGGLGGAGINGGGTGGTGGASAAAGSATSGASGGAAGYAVRKNGFTVPVTNNGTMTGTAA